MFQYLMWVELCMFSLPIIHNAPIRNSGCKTLQYLTEPTTFATSF